MGTMKRVVVGVLASTFLVGTIAAFTSDADAQRRRRRGRQAQQREPVTPESDAIDPAMGDIEWGWSRNQLVGYFTKKLRREYAPRIHKAGGAIEEDRLIHERNRKIQQLREGYVAFNGRTTGYDSGFLRDEFTHNNREAMLRVRSENADDYYFFIRGRLWKWYRAFDAAVFQGADFEQFGQALQGRFGEGRTRREPLTEGGEVHQWIEWQDDATRLRAIDQTTFYGFYCLVFESKETLANLDTLRTNRDTRNQRDSHALVDAVTRDDDASRDHHQDIVDRITGNIRRRTNAPNEDDGGDMSGSNDRNRDTIGDDPLRGLD